MPEFPVRSTRVTGVPINHHPGAFGFKRRKNFHTGIDIYVDGPVNVVACEAGRIIKINQFTGGDMSPWWNETWAVTVEGEHVINYGEVDLPKDLKVGDYLGQGQFISTVKNVIFPERARPDIPGHSIHMLHFEQYSSVDSKFDWSHWHHEGEAIPRDPNLLDPLPFLLTCSDFPHEKFVSWYNPDCIGVG